MSYFNIWKPKNITAHQFEDALSLTLSEIDCGSFSTNISCDYATVGNLNKCTRKRFMLLLLENLRLIKNIHEV